MCFPDVCPQGPIWSGCFFDLDSSVFILAWLLVGPGLSSQKDSLSNIFWALACTRDHGPADSLLQWFHSLSSSPASPVDMAADPLIGDRGTTCGEKRGGLIRKHN